MPCAPAAVIHIELHRMRRHAVAVLLLALEVEVALDLVLGEHIALEQELVVLLQALDRLLERAAHGGHLGELGRRQVVEVLSMAGPGWILQE
jgi:hypothetical protein